MKKFFLLGVLVLLLTLPFTLALTSHWDCENDLVDSIAGNNLTSYLGTTLYSTDVPSFNRTGTGGGKSCDFDTNAAYAEFSGGVYNYHQFTINLWAKDDDHIGSYLTVISLDPNSGQRSGVFLTTNSGNGLGFNYAESASVKQEVLWNNGSTALWDSDSWLMVTSVKNATGIYVYLNGTLKAHLNTTSNVHYDVNHIGFGGYNNDGVRTHYSPKRMDEMRFWSTPLSQQNITNLFNCGVPINCISPGIPGVPVWVDPTPGDGVTNNTQVVLNASCAAGERYFMYFDSSSTPTTLVLTNATTGNYTTSVGNGKYYYRAACYNTTSKLFSTNTSVRSWTYDIQAPAILLNGGNEFNDNNFSVLNQFDDWLNLTMNFTDNIDLFAWNITVNASNGTTVYTDQNASLSGTSWVMNRTVNVSSWPSGWYDFLVRVSDSHTAEKIPDYQVTNKKSSITFKPGNENNIKIETLESSDITATKLVDRYTFAIAFDDSLTKTRVFDVKTDLCPLSFVERSGFKAHLVSYCGGRLGGNWIDFEGAGGLATVVKLDDFHYRVTIEDVPGNVVFRSIGGLNTYARTWRWFRGDYATQDDRATAGDPFSLTLNLTADATFSLNASLLWNNTPQSVSTSSGVGWRAFTANFLNESLGTYWYYWSVNVTQSDGNFSSFSLNNTHEVEEWYIDACSAATNKTIRWNLFDEDSPSTPLTGTAEVLIEYWPVSMNNSKIFNHSYSSNTFFEVCMSPGDLNFSANIYLQNTHSSAFTHRFFVQNGSFNNVTTVYPIYNFVNKTGKSDMRLTTRQNNDYSYMENVLVYLQRLYVGEGDWRTVQMDRSGDYGLVFFNIIEEDTDYKILFYDMNNNLLHQTTSMKFACTAGVCEITQLLSDYVAATTTDQVEAVLSYDNTSRLISVVWSAPPLESHNVEFTATRETVTGPLTLCNNIQVGSGGTFTCNVTGVNGQVFVKTVVDGGLSPPVAEWVDVTTSSLGDNMTPAESSLWSFGIASTLVMIGLFSPVGALIGLVIGLIVIFFLGILNPLNLTFIILAVAASVAIGLKVKT